VRQAACQALGAMRDAGTAGVPALLDRAAHDDHEGVRLRAISALGDIGDTACVAPLAAILAEDGGTIGLRIADTLARMGRRARTAAQTLRDELHRDDPWLALAAAAALLAIEAHEDAAVWALVTLLQGADDEVRTEAAMVLGDFGPRAAAAVPALRAAESADDEELRAHATLAIAKIRPEEALRRHVAVHGED
jgi:HEAT repeat protein